MTLLRFAGIGLLMLLVQCKGEACGVHFEAQGPSANVDVSVRGPIIPIPSGKRDYLGVWKGSGVRIAIEEDGTLSYARKDWRGPVFIESFIRSFDQNGFVAGQDQYETAFRVSRPPHEESGVWKMTVDDVELTRLPDNRSLAARYMRGDGVERDPAKAVELLTKACDDEDIMSCFVLGGIYAESDDIPHDLVKTAELLQKGCDNKHTWSCANLGFAYMRGDGVEKNMNKAFELNSYACDRGDPRGCFSLGYQYDTGDGVRRDTTRATELYVKSCERNYGDACYNVALMFESGEGVPKNLEIARDAHAKACELGVTESCGR